MKVRQIELIGFKSFSDKTALSLHSGITCIVGPNGCGKSNVVDAFRWVLGEQSAKSLRGEKMEEVIFQGSATKKQKGMAEVTLRIFQSAYPARRDASENGAEEFHEEEISDEVIVSRRLYRSGESEYLLNKRQCRLKDIRDMFLDTGLDVKSYSILDQGRMTDVLNAKPQEKRFLIEEVAGVMKYKVRKAEALSKLESSKQNLQRVNDIVFEVKRQMNSLDRQVKKAERYKRFVSEVKEIELRMAKRSYGELSSALHSLLSQLGELKERDSAQRSELSTVENVIETKRLELVEQERALVELDNNLDTTEKAISESEKQMAVLRSEIENRRTEIGRLGSQKTEIDAKKEELSAKIAELEETVRILEEKMGAVTDELSEKKDWLVGVETGLSDKQSEVEEKRRQLFKISETLSDKTNELHRFQSSLETLDYRESVAQRDKNSVQDRRKGLEEEIREMQELIRKEKGEYQRHHSERETLSNTIAALKDEVEDKKILLSKEREYLASSVSRRNSLEELIVDRSLADFLSQRDAGSRVPGVVLSDIISAEGDFERAIEAALSDRINSLVVENIDDLMSVVGIIKEKNLGRTALLFTALNPKGSEAVNEIQTTNGAVLGKASDMVSFEEGRAGEEYPRAARDILRAVMDSIYVVRDIETALTVQKDNPSGNITIVTLNGEVITREGFLFAGQGKEILKRKREIKGLQGKIEEHHRTIKALEDSSANIAAGLSDKKEALRNSESALVEVEKRLSLAEHSLKNQRDEFERQMRKDTLLENEMLSLAHEKEVLKRHIESKSGEINLLEQEKGLITNDITGLQDSLAGARSEYEEARSDLTEMKLAATSYREKVDALKKEKGTLLDAISELVSKKELSDEEIAGAEEKIAEIHSRIQKLEEELKAHVAAAGALRQEKAAKKENIEAGRVELVFREQTVKRIRGEIDALSQELTELHSKAVETRLTVQNVVEGITQKYGLDIGAAEVILEGFDREEDESRRDHLNEKIKELGPVNLGTIEEFTELKSRCDFLSKQQQDLTMSIAELEEAINRINVTTKRKLREAYDALRAKFSEVFITLFGGGKADIILVEEENILESGLDVIAQPPGKKLQNINLLSGGEKALTSLALLFAGFLLKPSPLCILDEVDAPLDESNTVRFAQMIKELSGETQFIVITHNRTSMEVADYLYGITMEEAGVSKVISLQFSEVENMQYA